MEQSIELMRKRHTYYTKLIKEHYIHTAREFYNKFHELFAMFGVDLILNDSETECGICINCEDYDYEDYNVVDGEDGELAKVSPIVRWKDPIYLCGDTVDIFADRSIEDYVTIGL